jgi:hypothetical protein
MNLVAMDTGGRLWAYRNGMPDLIRDVHELKTAKEEDTGIVPDSLSGDTLLTWEEAEAVLAARAL